MSSKKTAPGRKARHGCEGGKLKRRIRVDRRSILRCGYDLNDALAEGLIEDQGEGFRPLQHLLGEGDRIHVVADIRVASVREYDVERHRPSSFLTYGVYLRCSRLNQSLLMEPTSSLNDQAVK